MAVNTAGIVARQRFGEAIKSERLTSRAADGAAIKQIHAARVIKRRTVDRVSRFERGEAWPEPWELDALLKLYGSDLASKVRLETMFHEGQAVGHAWWSEYEGEFPDSLLEFIANEDAAKTVTTCAGNVLPALLQTEEYAASLTTRLAGSVLPRDTVDRSVELRRKRRGIFRKAVPTPGEFIFSEAALRQQTGGLDVMREQLDSLLDDVGSLPVTLRVVPFSAAAASVYMVHLLEFAGADEPPVVVFDTKTGMTFQRRPKAIRESKYYIEAMRQLACSPMESATLVKTIREEMASA
jgi:Domain of unknown function (DUF5753)